jgi:hypothetical protein
MDILVPERSTGGCRLLLRGSRATSCRAYLRGEAVPAGVARLPPIVRWLALRLVPRRNANTIIYETASTYNWG